MARALPRKFYNRDTATVARELLGKRLVRKTEQGTMQGRIVETEAYLAEADSSSHSARGKTRRNASMFGPPGHAYVYTIHGRFCFNTVTEGLGQGSAVLIRAIEPTQGVEQMQTRRGSCIERDLTRGPARLCEALGLNLEWDGWDLSKGEELWIADGRLLPPGKWACSPRIGISRAVGLQLRFFLVGNRLVSGPMKFNRPQAQNTATKKQ